MGLLLLFGFFSLVQLPVFHARSVGARGLAPGQGLAEDQGFVLDDSHTVRWHQEDSALREHENAEVALETQVSEWRCVWNGYMGQGAMCWAQKEDALQK